MTGAAFHSGAERKLQFAPVEREEEYRKLLSVFRLPASDEIQFEEFAALAVLCGAQPVGLLSSKRFGEKIGILFLYLEPAVRTGTAMKLALKALLDHAAGQLGLRNVFWNYEISADAADPYERLLEMAGAKEITAERLWDCYRFHMPGVLKVIERLPRFDDEYIGGRGSRAVKFSELTEEEKAAIRNLPMTPELGPLQPFLDDDYDPELSRAFFDRKSGALCGFAVCRDKGQCCEFRKLYVVPERRSRQDGVLILFYMFYQIAESYDWMECLVADPESSLIRASDARLIGRCGRKYQVKMLRCSYPLQSRAS